MQNAPPMMDLVARAGTRSLLPPPLLPLVALVAPAALAAPSFVLKRPPNLPLPYAQHLTVCLHPSSATHLDCHVLCPCSPPPRSPSRHQFVPCVCVCPVSASPTHQCKLPGDSLLPSLCRPLCRLLLLYGVKGPLEISAASLFSGALTVPGSTRWAGRINTSADKTAVR
jgi:hypothetical protein